MHGMKGRGHWQAKIDAIVRQMKEAVESLNPERVVIEKPTYTTWGRGDQVANALALLATLDCAWSVAWALKGFDVVLMRPDRIKKAKRSLYVEQSILGWPKRTNEHVRDAAWLALRGHGLA